MELGGLRQALEAAFDDFHRLPHAWSDWWGHDRVKKKARAQTSDATTPSMPSTPAALTDTESDDKVGTSTVTCLHAKALEKLARRESMKGEDT